jgi:2-dehydropantoate 2-reductase
MYGAGAVGGVIGGRLARGGFEVVLIARGAHYRAIEASGLSLDGPDGSITLDIPVVDRPEKAVIGERDVVFLTMKSQDTRAAIADLSSCVSPDVTVVCAQNGLDNERTALRNFDHVEGALVYMPARYLEAGVVAYSSGPVPGVIDLGSARGGADDVAQNTAADLRAAGFSSVVREDIWPWKRRKLLSNLGNVAAALVEDVAYARDLATLARAEGEACFRAAGMEVTSSEAFWQRMADFRAQAIDGRLHAQSSSWQSLARQAGSIETDFLNGEAVLLGRLYGISTPVNALLQRLANEQARTKVTPGGVSVEQLSELLREIQGKEG